MTNLFIFGAGQDTVHLIEALSGSDKLTIAGVIDTDSEAPGIRSAKCLGIPTSAHAKDLLDKAAPGDTMCLVGNRAIYEALSKEIPGNMRVMDAPAFGILLKLAEECDKTKLALKEANDELKIQAWGLNKTNEAIKLLYNELADKNRRLQELDRLKSDFLSVVSHELRTPLTIMKEFTFIILDEIPGKLTADQKGYIEIIANNIDRLSRLISDLLDISKMEAKKEKLNKTFVNIINLAETVILGMKTQADKKNIELKTEFRVPALDVYVDQDKITQVFTNLIGNAVKFTPENGVITLAIADKDKEVECRLSDTGIGIAAEDLSKVFSKFQQFNRTEGPGPKGTGLGLAISKQLVELHSGKIWVDSEPGKGTKFTFILPKQLPEPSAEKGPNDK